jgi:hypothetical protein
MQIMLQGGLITVGVDWIPMTEFFIGVDGLSQAAIESHIKDGKDSGTIIQGGYKINWKKI